MSLDLTQTENARSAADPSVITRPVDHPSAADPSVIRQYSEKVLENCRNAELLRHRFLAVAFNRLKAAPDAESPIAFGTDGNALLLQPLSMLRRYIQDPASVEGMYLHTIVHCLYLHPFLARGRDKALWDLSSDLFVHEVMQKLGACRKEEDDQRRKEVLKILLDVSDRVGSAQGIYRTLERQMRESKLHGWQVLELASLFKEDDHDLWYVAENGMQEQGDEQSRDKTDGDCQEQESLSQQSEAEGESADGVCSGQSREKMNRDRSEQDSPPQKSEAEGGSSDGVCSGQSQDKTNRDCQEQDSPSHESESEGRSRTGAPRPETLSREWQEIARGVEVALRTESSKQSASMGRDAGSFLQTLEAVTRENYSYETFLKKFAVFEERLRTSPDEFDYIYYTYGLSLYGDVPLVEPLEYQEIKTIRTFVIAIDTSGSCDDELVRKFLTKTYNILCEGEVFAETVNVHVIQCDAAVQEDTVLQNREEIRRFADRMVIRGRGGTDFRPVFTYIEELQEKGDLRDLAGLLYFTDGYGVFPKFPPPFKTAFVFADQDQDVQVPPWAMKVYIEKEAL